MTGPIGNTGREAAAFSRALRARWLRKAFLAELAQPDPAAFGQGSVLPPATRRLMEALFERDLGDVRTFSGERVEKLAQTLSAEAFTVGSNVYLPTEDEAKRLPLLAHELTHVVQQQRPALIPIAPPARLSRQQEFGQKAGARGEVEPVVGLDAAEGMVPHLPVMVFEGTYLEEAPAPPQLAASEESGAVDAAEAEAQANEAALAQVDAQPSAAEMDAQEIADRVYRMMRDELLLERERSYQGRLSPL